MPVVDPAKTISWTDLAIGLQFYSLLHKVVAQLCSRDFGSQALSFSNVQHWKARNGPGDKEKPLMICYLPTTKQGVVTGENFVMLAGGMWKLLISPSWRRTVWIKWINIYLHDIVYMSELLISEYKFLTLRIITPHAYARDKLRGKNSWFCCLLLSMQISPGIAERGQCFQMVGNNENWCSSASMHSTTAMNAKNYAVSPINHTHSSLQ